MSDKIVLKETGSGNEYRITLPCVVGRGKEADLSLADPAVSHRHALIDGSGDRVWIQDLISANGTFVNSRAINEKTFLHPNDTIQFGKLCFNFIAPERKEIDQTLILHSLERTPEITLDHQRLDLIYAVTAELSEGQEIRGLGEKIFARFEEYFKQDRGYIALFQPNGALAPLCCVPHDQAIPLSRTIVNRIFENGESFVLADALANDSFKEQESIIAMHIRSAMCAPLTYHNQIYGLIYLDRNIAGSYDQSDLELFRSIAAIVAPLIENARLWSELREEYRNTVAKLRKTEARLIVTERIAAYTRVAQAMAHEIRNPLTSLGGLIRRIARSEEGTDRGEKFQCILNSVERIELVIREAENLTTLEPPAKKPCHVDTLIRQVLEANLSELQTKKLAVDFKVTAAHPVAPVEAGLFNKAIAMVLKEILLHVSSGATLTITLQDADDELELYFGNQGDDHHFGDPYGPEFADKPWCHSLFLNIAQKILLDHNGSLLLNIEGQRILPLIMRLPRTISVEDRIGAGFSP